MYQDIYQAISEYKLQGNVDDEIIISSSDNQILLDSHLMSEYLNKVVDNAIEEVNAELNDIVGLTEIKEYIFSLQDFYNAQKIRQREIQAQAKLLLLDYLPNILKPSVY